MADTARITEVDISRPSRALAVLRLSDFVLVVGCGLGAVGLLPDLAIAAVNAQLADIAGITLTAAAFAFAAYTGWRHVGVIDPRVWRSYLLVFPLLAAVVGVMGLALAFTSISEGQSLAPTPQSFLMVVGLVWYHRHRHSRFRLRVGASKDAPGALGCVSQRRADEPQGAWRVLGAQPHECAAGGRTPWVSPTGLAEQPCWSAPHLPRCRPTNSWP